jgi:hypothetical protein
MCILDQPASGQARLKLPHTVAFSEPTTLPEDDALKVGFRLGSKGTHSSRTVMLEEIGILLKATRPDAKRADYAAAVIEANCLSKRTASSRRLTNQRLGELYGLDTSIPLFRVFRRLWDMDADGRPLLALLTSLARDPLLVATWPVLASIPPGAELQRDQLREAIRTLVGTRLNENIIEKVCRNVASSWTQSGHLRGRTFKERQTVIATPGNAAFAIYLAHAAGCRGATVFASFWFQVIDCDPSSGRRLALEAKQLGLIDLRMAGEVVEFDLARLTHVTALR